MRYATYLINRVATRVLSVTPYELLKNKRPNIEHIRIFGCIAYEKIERSHLKKLDDRSHMLVHLGTEPGSKAYRLLDPVNRKEVVSRDVVFDETKSWNWKKCITDPEETREFAISFGDFGNRGVKRNNDNLVEQGTGVVGNDQTNIEYS